MCFSRLWCKSRSVLAVSHSSTIRMTTARHLSPFSKLCVPLKQTLFRHLLPQAFRLLQYQNSICSSYMSSSLTSFSVEVSLAPPSRVLLLTPSRTCLDDAASLTPPLRHFLCERFHISSLSKATPYFFSFSFCHRQWWLSSLDLLWGILHRFSSPLRFVIEILIIILIYFSLVFSCFFRLDMVIFDYQSCVWGSVRFWFDLSEPSLILTRV